MAIYQTLTFHSFAVTIIRSEHELMVAKAVTPAGTAHNVRRNKPRVSEGCGLRCARGKHRRSGHQRCKKSVNLMAIYQTLTIHSFAVTIIRSEHELMVAEAVTPAQNAHSVRRNKPAR